MRDHCWLSCKATKTRWSITTIVFIAKETAHHIPKIIDPDDVEAHSKRRLKRRYIEAKVQTTFEVTLTKPMALNRNLEI